jgi:hypothetical protein
MYALFIEVTVILNNAARSNQETLKYLKRLNTIAMPHAMQNTYNTHMIPQTMPFHDLLLSLQESCCKPLTQCS